MAKLGGMEEKTKVYVGNLGTGVSRRELKRAFSYYGPLRTVWIVKNPPGFPFVEFEDPTHAEDAVQDLDGKVICGSRMRVELPTGMLWRSDFENRPLAQHSFGPSDKCGKKGHHAYDCHHYSQQRGSRLQISQSPDLYLQKEIIPHQEVHKEVQVLKE
uniref:RRM domain-containing protein n=1 Tax=Canis lupus dingo TaxID=286419 RepID=A0A8C0KIC3_CANLU